MPSVIGTAFVKVIPDTTGFAAATAAGVNGAAGSVAGAATKLGKAMTLGVTAPVIGIGVAAVNTFRDFENGMLGVEAVTGATGDTLLSLRDKAKELGSSTQFSAGEAAGAMEFLGMAGFDANQILEATPGILDLAAAGGLSLAAAADGASNVLQGFGKEASEINKINDELAFTAANSNTSVQQLIDAMSFAAPVANGLGVSSAEAAAHIGILSDAGIQGGRAGTSMARIYADLANATGPAAAKMAELGISTIDSAGQLLDFDKIVAQFGNSTADASDIMQIFGKRGGPAMLAILERGSQDAFEFAEAIDQAEGAAKDMAETRMSGLEGAILKLKSAWEGFLLAVAESGLIDIVAKVATSFTKVFASLANMNPAIFKSIAAALMLAAAVGPLIMIFGKLMNPIVLVGAVIGGLIAWFTKLIGANAFLRAGVIDAWMSLTAMIGHSVTRIKLALKAALGGGEEFGEGFGTQLVAKAIVFTNWITNVAIPAFTRFAVEWIPKLVKAGRQVGTWISEFAGWVQGEAIPAVQDFAKWLGPKLAAVGKFVGRTVQMIVGFFQSGFGKTLLKIVGVFAAVWGALSLLGTAFLYIAPIVGSVIGFFSGLWAVIGSIIGVFSSLFSLIGTLWALFLASPILVLITAIVALGAAIYLLWTRSETFRNIIFGIWDAIKSFGLWIAGLAVSFGVWVASMAVHIWNFIKAVGQFFVTLWGYIVGFKNTVVAVFWAIWNGIGAALMATWNFIKVVWNFIVATVVGAAMWIKNAVVAAFNFLVVAALAIFNILKAGAILIWTSFWTGVTLIVNLIKHVVVTTFRGLKIIALAIFRSLKAVAMVIWNGIKTSIITPARQAKNKALEIFRSAKTKAIEIFNKLKDKATEIWDGISDAISNAVDRVIGFVNSILGPIESVIGKFTDFKNAVSNFDIGSIGGLLGGIPGFAKGGLVTSPTIGMVGEAGPELILPLSDKARMRELLTKAQPFGTGFALDQAPRGTGGQAASIGGSTFNFNGVDLSEAMFQAARREEEQLAGIR